MIDFSVKFAVVTAAVWLLTRGLTPAGAAAAHRAWLAVMATPLLWLVANTWITPSVYVSARSSDWPRVVTDPGSREVQLALAVYGVVAAALLLRIGAGVFAVRTLLRHATALPPDDVVHVRRLLGAASLDIREAALRMPVTAGFVRPAILLPVGWRALPEPALTAILAHEAAHVRRRDCLVALACALAEAAFWFHPAVWLATARVRWFAEMACDAEAARTMSASEYAAQLLALADRWNDAPPPRHAITAGAGTRVSRRLALLVQELESGARRRRAFLFAPAVILLLLALARVEVTARAWTPAAAGLHDHASHAARHQQRHAHSMLNW